MFINYLLSSYITTLQEVKWQLFSPVDSNSSPVYYDQSTVHSVTAPMVVYIQSVRRETLDKK